jgi:hypothetical protein
MRKTAVLFVAVCRALLGAGCEAELGGTCDTATSALAYTVACTSELNVQYGGQALVNGTCASGHCHSVDAVNDDTRPDVSQRNLRYGVPGGFDFDLQHAATAEELERLRNNRAYILDHAAEFFGTVESGDMPREGEVVPPVDAEQGVVADTGAPLPTLNTAAGRAMLRAWLICGAPVVERTSDAAPAPGTPVGDALDPTICDEPEPTFESLFEKVIRGSCAVEGCHAGVPPDGTAPSGMMLLDPDDPALSYASLVGVAAMGAECGDAARTRVVAGNPDASLLIQKLEGDGSPDGAECGDRMPQGGPYLRQSTINVFREWITAGAPPPTP